MGAGDSSVEIVDYILNDKKFDLKKYNINIFDDNFKNLKYFRNLSKKIKLHKLKKINNLNINNSKALITFGKPELRDKFALLVSKKKIKLFTLIHSTAYISKTSKIGLGSIICPMCVIGSYSKIDKNVFINSSSLIGHNTKIKMNSVISPNCFFGGNSILGQNTFVGASSTIYPKIKILNHCKIVAGSSVTKNVLSKSFVYGNPATIVNNKLKIY